MDKVLVVDVAVEKGGRPDDEDDEDGDDINVFRDGGWREGCVTCVEDWGTRGCCGGRELVDMLSCTAGSDGVLLVLTCGIKS